MIAATLLLLGLAGLVSGWHQQAQRGLDTPPARDDFGYAGSTACQSCHADHHASWHRTFHRTMTQEASRHSVQGAFDGRVLDYWGKSVRPTLHEGRHVFELLDPATGAARQRLTVARTVGSHRYQQYLAEGADGRYLRLPLLWHNGDQRWVHVNGAFLYDDNQGFNQHGAVWNPNCIFCHNTGPEPRIQNADDLFQRLRRGERFNYLEQAQWDSRVAELGIACETCHGPGAQHAEANRNPVRRYWLHFSERPDPTIVNPRRLSPERAAFVCGQCHAQRLPARAELVDRWLDRGPTYRAGEDLREHVQFVTRDTPVPAGDPDTFRLRFWPDGTPRLSAYELQGLMQSDCYSRGGATCIGCHEAHGGDPAGMITADNRQGAACQDCHAGIEAELPAHRRHAAASPETACVDCHMPKLAYGVMEIHRSHRIESPSPLAQAGAQRPETCSGCHGDRSANWAEASLQVWREGGGPAAADTGMPENLRQLFAGDPVQRAVAARLADGEQSALDPPARRAQLPLLLAAMEDGYPAVRRFAQQSAQRSASRLGLPALGEALASFDFIAAPALRTAALERIRALSPPPMPGPQLGGLLAADGQPDAERLELLRSQADRRAINIGE